MTDFKEEESLQRLMGMRASLFSFLSMLLPPQADVESVFQEVVIAAWRAAKRGEVEKFEPFVYGVARNQAKLCLRKMGRDRIVLCDGPLLDELVSQWNSQVGTGSGSDRQHALRTCMSKMKEQDRNRLTSYYTNGQTIRSLADQERRSEWSLQQVFHRLRVKLKQCIDSEVAGDGGLA